MKRLDFSYITKDQISDMQDLIAAHADRNEAKRFNKLPFTIQQTVTAVLRNREWRMRKMHRHIDYEMVREIIDNARAGKIELSL